jgi:hypothetical protein
MKARFGGLFSGRSLRGMAIGPSCFTMAKALRWWENPLVIAIDDAS